MKEHMPVAIPAFSGDEFTGDRPRTPEHNLLAEIVVRAILDYAGPARTATHHFRSARRFFYSRRTEPFSFIWISEHLSDDPVAYRTWLLSQLERFRMLGKDVETCNTGSHATESGNRAGNQDSGKCGETRTAHPHGPVSGVQVPPGESPSALADCSGAGTRPDTEGAEVDDAAGCV
jgi:hypothetical protein